MTFPVLPYTLLESAQAHAEWNAMCGHHSIAAAVGVGLDAIRDAGVPLKGWMSPTMITRTLEALHVQFTQRHLSPARSPANVLSAPSPQILRMQFEGSWMRPGVPVGAQYQRTHYIALFGPPEQPALIMDPLLNACGIHAVDDWLAKARTPDYLAESSFKGTTGWHFTHTWRLGASA